MNQIEHKLKQALQEAVQHAFGVEMLPEEIVIELPKQVSFGDYSSNVAMRLAKQLRQNPKMIAQEILNHLDNEKAGVRLAEPAGVGFINFFMLQDRLTDILM